QAEDGIRDLIVTGVQTCALPISTACCIERSSSDRALQLDSTSVDAWLTRALVSEDVDPTGRAPALQALRRALAIDSLNAEAWDRSEERRVGKEGRLETWRVARRQ